jgi:hypothetical protein
MEIKLSAVEQNPNPVVFKAAKASRVGFDHLNLRVQTFSDSVGDRMPQIRQNVLQMVLEHARHLDHRLDPAATHPAKPVLEKTPSRPLYRYVHSLVNNSLAAHARDTFNRCL